MGLSRFADLDSCKEKITTLVQWPLPAPGGSRTVLTLLAGNRENN